MNIYAPDYYPQFKCIAGNCKHTCCQEWEIDIDDETLKKYMSLDGAMGERLKKAVSLEGEAHIAFNDKGYCPMLNKDGLCDVIIELGEDWLCDICKDHPRFRNFRSDRIEIGVGLVCEEACRLILSQKIPLRIIKIEGDDPDNPNESEIFLEDVRNGLLDAVTETGPRARLKEYLIYRHLCDALYDDRLEARIQFIDEAYGYILKNAKSDSIEDISSSAIAFSDEFEYDDEKLEAWIANCEQNLYN